MNPEPINVRVLFIEDSQHDVELILRALRKGRIRGDWRRVHKPDALREALLSFSPDVLLADFTMPGFSGIEALKIATELRPDVPFIFVSGTIGEERAIEALREGASDYVLKSNLARLVPALKRVLQETKERIAGKKAQQQLATQYAVSRILAEAATFEEALPKLFEAICEYGGYLTATLWAVDRDAAGLQCVDVWTTGAPELTEFAARMRELKIAPNAGLAGRAWASRKPVWIPDASREDDSSQTPVAVKAGLHAGVAFPIAIRREVKGVMVFFGPDVREPDAEVLEMFRAIGSQIGQFMERQAQQAHIARLNRVYAVLSGINSTIIRVRDRQALFNEACRIAVEHGNFGIAWIGLFDPATLDVTPVAWAGFNAEQFIVVGSKATARSDIPHGQGVLGRAIREKRPFFDNDIAIDRRVGGKRREEALKRGYRSLMVLPLIVEGEVVAILALFARELDFFTKDEVKLLTELAGDISFALEHIGKREQIEHLVNYDALTGVANRNLLNDRLAQAVSQARRHGDMVAVAFLDLDNFKWINDSLGHKTGDELLKMVAARLGSCVRDTDTLARLGGDEFVLILPGQNDATTISRVVERINNRVSADPQVVELLQKILGTVSEPMVIGERELRLTCSIGVSLYPQDGEDAEALLKNAAAALSRAKQLGRRNVQFYTAEINSRIAERLSLHSALRRALERDEFILHYQPKINLHMGELSGVEALLRWNNPESGIILPNEFIPVLEETGLIIDVGRWVMEKAVNEYDRWLATSLHPPRIAVNVSQLQLAQKEFPAVVEKILKNNASGPGGLDLEITESLIMQNLEANIPKLKAIREMGVQIVIDDFGTGYSSLSYLAKLPVNTLKIDRSFIRDMENSSDGLAIVTTIISLAHSLGVNVIAEGVETEAQIDTLRLLKCDEIQGYVISRPLPEEQFRIWWEHFLSKPGKPGHV
jgi:diguanylate cyclase (GGDEF)-like protein